MGYDLHITRKPNWWDEEGPSIDASEWDQLLAEDPSLCGLFWYADGNLVTKHLDEAEARRMIEIAQRFNATIQGDDGEFYDLERLLGNLTQGVPPKQPLRWIGNYVLFLLGWCVIVWLFLWWIGWF